MYLKRALMLGAILATVPAAVSIVRTPQAKADPICVKTWLDKKDGSTTTLVTVCQPTPFPTFITTGTNPTSTNLPGPYTGAGAEIDLISS